MFQTYCDSPPSSLIHKLSFVYLSTMQFFHALKFSARFPAKPEQM